MHKVAEVELDDLWGVAAPGAIERVVDLARKALSAPAAEVFSSAAGPHNSRYVADPQNLLASGTSDDAAGAVALATIVAPIVLSSGSNIGTMRVVDEAGRVWSRRDRDVLDALASCFKDQVELQLEISGRRKIETERDHAKAHLLAVADRIPGLVFERRKIDGGRSRYTFFGNTKLQLPAVRKMMEDGSAGDLSFVHRDDREMVRAAILGSTLEETDLDLTFRVKDFERRVRWLRSQSIVRRDSDGTVCWDGLVFDISDLVAAREDAEAARTAKDKLLVDVDHELRKPLRAIVGFADVLESERHSDHAAAQARNIRLAAETLLSGINHVVARAGNQGPGSRVSSTDSEARPAEPNAERPLAIPPTASPRPAGARILLADDLDLNRKLITDMLSIEGYSVECVADGAAAVRMASRHSFDLVLMDMVMPVMDGIAAAQAIRALPAPACHVPIVALTAHSQNEQLDACLKAGMDAILTKPMSIDALNRTVETWIGRRSKAA